MSPTSLTELVRRIEGGDDQAWSALIRRLTPAVYSAVRKFDVDEEVRKDAMSEVWRILFERISTIEDPERLHKWVSVVACNHLITTLRRPEHRRELATDDDYIETTLPVEDPDDVVRCEVVELLDGAVARLSPREQLVVRGRAYTDDPQSLASMERRYGIPAGSIGPTLGRSLAKLRRDPQLRRFFDELHRHDRAEDWYLRAAS